MSHALIARQAIVDRNVEVRAYELLFRSNTENVANVQDGDSATATVAMNMLLEIGLEPIAGDHQVFVNLTRSFFTEDMYTALPPGRVVLEVLEDIHPDGEIIAAVTRAKRQGYRIALDDYVHNESKRALVALADIIKVDAGQMNDDGGLREHVRILRRRGLTLLAEKVETRDQFKAAWDAGYDLFQGWFYAKPDMLKRKKLTANRESLLRIMAALEDPSVEFEEISALIERDMALSHKLLRYMNSAALSLAQRVQSVRHACTLLGIERVRSIARLLLLAEVTDKPRELLLNALSRARLCQLLAGKGSSEEQKFFTVGLFSLLDVYLDTSMEALLNEMPLSAEVKDALLDHRGNAGSALDAAVACERADWDAIRCAKMPAEELQKLYVSALNWTLQVEQSLVDMRR